MARKRKAGGKPFGWERAAATTKDREDESSKLKINTYADVADSEDEFHLNRDEILLGEEPEAKRQRKWREEDAALEPSDEEVLDYDEPSDSEDDSEDEEEEEDAHVAPQSSNGGQPDDSDAASDEDEDAEEGWGPSKSDYYNADVIETEQDALDEEAEAKRLQQKHMQSLREEDFALDLDEEDWANGDTAEGNDKSDGHVVTEVLPQLQITDAMGPEERLKLLKTRYPEFEPLSKEFLNLSSLHDGLKLAAQAAEDADARKGVQIGTATNTKPVAVIKYRALASYLACIAMYFAFLTTPGSDGLSKPPLELREHPVMDELVKCRELWMKVKDLQIPKILVEESPVEPRSEPQPAQNGAPANGVIIDGELIATNDQPKKKKKKSKAQKAAEAAEAEAAARQAEKMRALESELADLSSLAKATKKTQTKSMPAISAGRSLVAATDANESDDLGDETQMTAHEAAEKAKKKKSLRFYTSQIAQKANKRGAASKDTGGDLDIPRRERLKERAAKFEAQQERRMRRTRDEQGDGADRSQPTKPANGGADEGDYYDMVSARTQKKKADKKAMAEAYAQAEREGGQVIETATVGSDGRREITYAIEKNKGLTPHRKKEVRNPRVKKRMRYEDKKKKLGSTKAVYKGGEGKGGYKGELTGIKGGIVRSVKLG